MIIEPKITSTIGPTINVKKDIRGNEMNVEEFIKEKEKILKENNSYIKPVSEPATELKDKSIDELIDEPKENNSKKTNKKNKTVEKEEE